MPTCRLDLVSAEPDSADRQAAVREAARLLSGDGVVLLPTETMYALAGRLASPGAVARLRGARPGLPGARPGLPGADLPGADLPPPPLTLHVASPDHARELLGPDLVPPGSLADRMLRRLWPGPVGLVFDLPPPEQSRVAQRLGVPAHEVVSPAGQITLRCPDHPLARDVLAATPHPVVCTQAQTTTGRPAHRLADVATPAFDAADLVLDAGPTRHNRPSTLLHVLPDRFELLRAGVYDQRIIHRMLSTTLLFVCSGNTCRSPMAMALARRLLADRLNLPESDLHTRGIHVLSAGTMAFPGARATAQAVQAARELGADLSTHRSQPLTIELIHQAHTIFTMSQAHRTAVLALVPSAADKTFPLSPTGDIEDPIGSDVSVYRELALKMQSLLAQRLAELPL